MPRPIYSGRLSSWGSAAGRRRCGPAAADRASVAADAPRTGQGRGSAGRCRRNRVWRPGTAGSRGGDEAEWGCDHRSPGPQPAPDAQMERGGAGRHGDGVSTPSQLANSRSKRSNTGAGESVTSAAPRAPAPPRARRGRDGRTVRLDVACEGVEPAGSDSGDCSCPPPFARLERVLERGDDASQDASMIFSGTPIEAQDSDHRRIEQDARRRLGPIVDIEDPDLVVDRSISARCGSTL